MPAQWKVQIIWTDGEDEFVKEGDTGPDAAVFDDKAEAEELAAAVRATMTEDQYRSVDVVLA